VSSTHDSVSEDFCFREGSETEIHRQRKDVTKSEEGASDGFGGDSEVERSQGYCSGEKSEVPEYTRNIREENLRLQNELSDSKKLVRDTRVTWRFDKEVGRWQLFEDRSDRERRRQGKEKLSHDIAGKSPAASMPSTTLLESIPRRCQGGI